MVYLTDKNQAGNNLADLGKNVSNPENRPDWASGLPPYVLIGRDEAGEWYVIKEAEMGVISDPVMRDRVLSAEEIAAEYLKGP
jgi:hypothetical protein